MIVALKMRSLSLARAAVRAPWDMVRLDRGRRSPGTPPSIDSRAGRQSLLISLPFLSLIAAASSPDPGSLCPVAGWIDGQRWRNGAAFVQPALRAAVHPAVEAACSCPRSLLKTPARSWRPLLPSPGLSAGRVTHGLWGGVRMRGGDRTGMSLAAGESAEGRDRSDGEQSDPWLSHRITRLLARQGAGHEWPPPWVAMQRSCLAKNPEIPTRQESWEELSQASWGEEISLWKLVACRGGRRLTLTQATHAIDRRAHASTAATDSSWGEETLSGSLSRNTEEGVEHCRVTSHPACNPETPACRDC